MGNILTDVLGFFKRRKFVKESKPDDVLILGINESPDMLGIASPVPYKDVKLIKIKDLKVPAKECERVNLGNTGEPLPFPPPDNVAGIFKNVTTDAQTGDCFANFRSLKSVSLNLSITQNLNDIEFDTLGEPNTAANVGTGVELYQSKVGETLNFRTLVSGDNTVTFSQGADEIDIRCAIVTYDLSGSLTGQNEYTFQLNGSDQSVDKILLQAGTGIAVTSPSAGTVEISTDAENNTASNVGAGQGIFKQKNGTDLEFYSLISSDNSIDIDLITQDNVIDLTATQDGNTTYDLVSAQAGSNVNLNLTGSDGTTDTVQLIAGTGISLTDNGSNQITVSSADANTTYTYDLSVVGQNHILQLVGSDGSTDSITLIPGTNVAFTVVGDTIDISATDTQYDLNAVAAGANVDINLNDTTGSTTTVTLVPGGATTISDLGSNSVEISSVNTTNSSLTLNNQRLDLLDSDGNTVSADLSSLDTDTKYDLTSSQNASDVDITLDGSDGTADNIKLVAGTNITLSDNGSNEVTINATDTDTNTTYDLGSAQNGSDVDVTLTGSDATTDTVKLVAGTNVTLTDNGSSQVTINAAGGGEVNTASNVGTGAGEVFKQKTGVDFEFRTIRAGANTTVTNATNNITIDSADTTYSLGAVGAAGNINVALTGSGGTNDVVGIQAGTNITLTDNGSNTFTIDATGGSGEVNTASNLGAGNGVFAQKTGADLQFKSLIAGSNISLVPTGNDITISATGGGSGEANTASNVGTGAGEVFKQKTGVDLELKTIKAGTNITITNNPDDITINATGGSGEVNTASNVGTGAGVFKQKTGVDLELRKINAGANVTVTENPNDITIAATDTDTTYSLKSLQNTSNVDLLLDASGTGTDTKVTLVAGTNITLTDNGSAQVRIDAAGGASCATTTTIGGMIVGKIGQGKPSPGEGTAISVEVNEACEGYVTVPDPPVKAVFQAIWTGAVNPYFNVTNGTQQVFPYDGFPLNYASVGAGQCVPSINVSPTGTTFDVAIGGYYKVSVNAHFFNLINGVNIDVEFSNNTTSTIQGIINQEGIYSNDEDVNFFGEYIVPIAAGDNIDVRILFSGGGTNPYPASARNLFCSMTLEKVD